MVISHLAIYSKSLTCLLYFWLAVPYSILQPFQHLQTSPSFGAFQRDGGTQSTSGPRPPWHRLGWSVVPRLHNVGRPSEAAAADQLWDFLQIN
jgi:hypothetical protein